MVLSITSICSNANAQRSVG